ncbi:MAG TPA: methylated-DNA--[protein]-cysteine S-methyltransferase [Candidatus Binatia bacterium]|jgi:methylated-DNA-[protein]-cysteine S-methyltransferase
MASNSTDPGYIDKMKGAEMKPIEARKEKDMKYYLIVQSPVGDLTLVAYDGALTGVYFAGRDPINAAKGWTRDARHPVLREAAKQLREYFAGKRKSFALPLRLAGTDFQQRVWREIARIPYGQTVSYSALAERAGAPRAVRAAGTSTGRNPAAIVVPCHRIMGKNGDLCGFGGGLERKVYLLKLENPDMSLDDEARKKTAPRKKRKERRLDAAVK